VLQSAIENGQRAAQAVADLLDAKTGEKTRFLQQEVIVSWIATPRLGRRN
jgi:hypothetical protein